MQNPQNKSQSIRFSSWIDHIGRIIICVTFGPSKELSLPEIKYWINLWPLQKDIRPQNPFSTSSLQAVGTSTAAMPELWRHWLRTCSESHLLCRALEGKESFTPHRLVKILTDDDTNEAVRWQLIVRADDDPSVLYCTLSHCWGSSNHLKLTKSTLHVFLDSCPASILPKTYRDALDITVSLGFTYIWIDSLCIIQDDLDDWRTQSSTMTLVYGNTRCNIAATWASNSDQGCFHERDPCMVVPTTIKLDSKTSRSREYQLSHESLYDDDILSAPLNSRGWVVQERCLAPKQLSFAEYRVYWECPEIRASEDYPNGLPQGVWDDDMITSRPTVKPRLNFDNTYDLRRAWCSLVETYSSCKLTQRSDKMVALAGMAGEFRRMTGDVYLAGLWKTDLDKQLCWSYSLNHDIDDRRLRISGIHYNAPTWSWTSLDCPISTDYSYFDQNSQRVRLISIEHVSVDTKNPTKLVDFTSGELQMQAIALTGYITLSEDEDSIRSREFVPHFTDPAKIGPISEVNDFLEWMSLFLDEDIGRSIGKSQEMRWHQILEERKSGVLFVFVSGWSEEWDTEADECGSLQGLILRKESKGVTLNGGVKFVRIGMFSLLAPKDLLFRVLALRLGLQANESLVDKINFNDSRLADLVHAISII